MLFNPRLSKQINGKSRIHPRKKIRRHDENNVVHLFLRPLYSPRSNFFHDFPGILLLGRFLQRNKKKNYQRNPIKRCINRND